jgi:ABC-type oligopeptide transport system ATPase subunit
MRLILEVKNLSTHFATQSGIVLAVDSVDLAVNEGDTLVGNSGIKEGAFCHPF